MRRLHLILIALLLISTISFSTAETQFPDTFMFGVATAAYQNEGNLVDSDWYWWEEQGMIAEDGRAGNATNDFVEWKKNVQIAKDLGVQIYRFSVDWSRIEPREGEFNQAGIEYYKNLVRELKENDIEPFVTLHHFTIPKWFLDKGGFSQDQNLDDFKKFVEKIVPELDEVGVRYWITLNEPAVYASLAYGSNRFPPGAENFFLSFDTFYGLIEAHNIAYNVVKEVNPDAQVGIAKHLRDYEPGIITFFRGIVLNRWFLGLTKDSDFIGVNYYYRCNWADKCYVHPEGLYNVLMDLKKYNKPIYITENGMPTENETERINYIQDHLKSVKRAMDEGLDIRGYIHWTFFDNFEWERGWKPKFGLMTTDKQPKESYEVYKEICKTGKVN